MSAHKGARAYHSPRAAGALLAEERAARTEAVNRAALAEAALTDEMHASALLHEQLTLRCESAEAKLRIASRQRDDACALLEACAPYEADLIALQKQHSWSAAANALHMALLGCALVRHASRADALARAWVAWRARAVGEMAGSSAAHDPAKRRGVSSSAQEGAAACSRDPAAATLVVTGCHSSGLDGGDDDDGGDGAPSREGGGRPGKGCLLGRGAVSATDDDGSNRALSPERSRGVLWSPGVP